MKERIFSLAVVTAVIMIANPMFSQSAVCFGYDASGNRTSRTIVVTKTTDATDADSTDQQQYVDLFSDMKVTISPNPNGGRFAVIVEQFGESINESSALKMTLHSMNGEVIHQIDKLKPINQVDISFRPNGTYILIITNGSDKRTWKVIKQ